MSGRAEQDQQREEWIKQKLINQPQIIQAYMLSIKYNKTSSTRKAYLGYLIEYVDFINKQGIKLTEVLPMHLDLYINYIKEGNGNSIVNAKLSAVGSFYNYLLKNKYIDSNPYDSKEMLLEVEEKDSVVYLTKIEENKLKRKAVSSKVKYANRDLCIITLGCATGLRVSAIRNIDIEDIDFDNMTIDVIEKGKKARKIFIGENTVKVIKTWMEDREKIFGNNTGALFMSQKKNRIAVRTIEDMIHNASKGIDKHITPHKMRSTFAMKVYDKSGDINLTSELLGHKNPRNTKKYAKATEERKREAIKYVD